MSKAMSTLRIFPQQKERVETGPIRFGDDWPGVFFRGDNALMFAAHLRNTINLVVMATTPEAVEVKPSAATVAQWALSLAVVEGLISELESCHAKAIEDMRTWFAEHPE